jgi:hypothetical protein
MPTGMDRLTSDQWSLGPAAVGLMMPGNWVFGLLVSNVWDIGGITTPLKLTSFPPNILSTTT